MEFSYFSQFVLLLVMLLGLFKFIARLFIVITIEQKSDLIIG